MSKKRRLNSVNRNLQFWKIRGRGYVYTPKTFFLHCCSYKFVSKITDEAREEGWGLLDPVHTTPFLNINDTVLFRIRLPSTLQRSENGSFRNRSPGWNDLKMVLFENTVFLVWTAKTILSENDDVTTTPPPGCRPLNREYIR